MSRLLQNAVFIPEDNVYLVSESTDEPVSHTYRDGKVLTLQGGLYWAHRGGDYAELLEAGRYAEWLITDEDSNELAFERALSKTADGQWLLNKDLSL